MSNLNELFEQGSKSGQEISNAVMRRRADPLGRLPTQNLIDPAVDRSWAGYSSTEAPNSYFDYFFTGQDIQVYVDGTEEFSEFKTIPINNIQFNVSQTKSPLYGFWSYTYDAVMRGVRIVEGQMTIYTKSPDYMRRLLEKAAETRSNRSASYTYFRGLTEDDSNIDKYWGKNIDPALQSAGKNIFSVHPPFSFVMMYGVQSISLDSIGSAMGGRQDLYQAYHNDNPLMTDVNERLVESDPIDQANRLILDAVELTGMSTGYGSDGSVVTETYSFFARDIITPPRDTRSSGTQRKTQVPTPGGTGGSRVTYR